VNKAKGYFLEKKFEKRDDVKLVLFEWFNPIAAIKTPLCSF
jgi:hypothetical protein